MPCFLYQPQIHATFFFSTLSVLQLITLRTGSLVWVIEEESLHSIRTSFFSDEIYLGYSAAIHGKLSDHLASWPRQRQPWCSQKTSIQKLQTGYDKNNWQHLSLSPIQCLHHRLQHKHLKLKTKVLRFNNLIQVQSLRKLQIQDVVSGNMKSFINTKVFPITTPKD